MAENALPLLGDPVAPTRPLHPVFALGFRPFFLLGALFAALWVPLWLLQLQGLVTPPVRGLGMTWHAHEMVFGFGAAVVAGFLLTAVRKWTSQAVPTGAPLAGLVALWVAGRAVMLFGAALPPALVALIDCAFLPLVALAIAVPVARARNLRNVAFPLLLVLLAGLNVAYHLGDGALAHQASRLGVVWLVLLVALVGGRVIPFFTRSAEPSARVRGQRALDWVAVLSIAALLPLQLLALPRLAAGVALVAGVANLARLATWDPAATRRRPILWILHLAYLWVGVGLLMMGAGYWLPALARGATHALTVGAIGTMIVGMITRVSLGHTGRPLVASRAVVWAYGLITVAALLRVVLPLLLPDAAYLGVLVASAACWSLAFAIFAVVFWPILTTPRPDGAPG